ncbi:hypothetical protein M405DRAFT_515037 [Rhizopogon salebrosus TDB-379]|nr:hypothetical protein M405DRAFT_515037 [Rhizopogon salebrosus TDB-379]
MTPKLCILNGGGWFSMTSALYPGNTSDSAGEALSPGSYLPHNTEGTALGETNTCHCPVFAISSRTQYRIRTPDPPIEGYSPLIERGCWHSVHSMCLLARPDHGFRDRGQGIRHIHPQKRQRTHISDNMREEPGLCFNQARPVDCSVNGTLSPPVTIRKRISYNMREEPGLCSPRLGQSIIMQ